MELFLLFLFLVADAFQTLRIRHHGYDLSSCVVIVTKTANEIVHSAVKNIPETGQPKVNMQAVTTELIGIDRYSQTIGKLINGQSSMQAGAPGHYRVCLRTHVLLKGTFDLHLEYPSRPDAGADDTVAEKRMRTATHKKIVLEGRDPGGNPTSVPLSSSYTNELGEAFREHLKTVDLLLEEADGASDKTVRSAIALKSMNRLLFVTALLTLVVVGGMSYLQLVFVKGVLQSRQLL